MNIKKRLTREIITLGIIFIAIGLVLSIIFITLNNSLQKTINESDPATEIIDHMISDIFKDNLFLLGYLNTKSYEEAINFDKELRKSDQRCNELESNIEDLIISRDIQNSKIISYYRVSRTLHDELEEVRNELIAIHKEEFATNKNLRTEKEALIQSHGLKFNEAVEKLSGFIDEIEKRDRELRAKMMSRLKSYALSIFILTIFFMAILIYKIKGISDKILEPIEETMKKTSEFVDGKYTTRIKPNKEIPEIENLQKNINNVFKAVEESSKDPKEKDKIEINLLKKEYHEIINYIKSNAKSKKQTTITDLKKHLEITHPTVLSRIKYLERKDYIRVIKQGREKFLILRKKARDL